MQNYDSGPARCASVAVGGMRRDLLVPGRDEAWRPVALERRQERDVRVAAEPEGLLHATVGQEVSDVVGNRRVHAHLRKRSQSLRAAPASVTSSTYRTPESDIRNVARLGVAVSSLLAASR